MAVALQVSRVPLVNESFSDHRVRRSWHFAEDCQVERVGGGLKVTSTIDLELQETARKAIDSVLKKPAGPSAALVAIDPRTGAVRAMVGGSNPGRKVIFPPGGTIPPGAVCEN